MSEDNGADPAITDKDARRESRATKGDGGNKDKADRLRDKISASQARTGSRATRHDQPGLTGSEATKGSGRPPATDGRSLFEKTLEEHPLALIAGSVVLGAVAASLVPAMVRSRIGARLLGLAALAGDVGAAVGSKAWEAAARNARSGQEHLDDLGDKLSDHSDHAARRASELAAIASRRALELAEAAAANARELGGDALKRLGSLSGRER